MEKYLKPQNKNKRGTHNRPYHGVWYNFPNAKERRKEAKALRHKLLFHIPLTEDEQRLVDSKGITATTQIDKDGFFRNGKHAKSDRWRFADAKENAQAEIKLGIRNENICNN